MNYMIQFLTWIVNLQVWGKHVAHEKSTEPNNILIFH